MGKCARNDRKVDKRSLKRNKKSVESTHERALRCVA